MRRLLTPGWLLAHAMTAALVAGMLALAWWQLSRATGGNGLSWGYAFQWPVFAGFVGYVWWREVRRAYRAATAGPAAAGIAGSDPAPRSAAGPDSPRRTPVITRRPAPIPASYDDAEDPELAAYHRYLAWMRANPGARPVDYPG